MRKPVVERSRKEAIMQSASGVDGGGGGGNMDLLGSLILSLVSGEGVLPRFPSLPWPVTTSWCLVIFAAGDSGSPLLFRISAMGRLEEAAA